MTQLPFIKMHGAENDYIFFDGLSGPLPQNPSDLALQICDRHAAIGADGIICLVPPADDSCDVEMRIWNADGSAAEMCGNGARCVAVWMQHQSRIQGRCRIRIDQRVVTAHDICSEGHSGSARINMGSADLLTSPEGQSVTLDDGTVVSLFRVRIGNPHAVLFVDELDDRLVHECGAEIERHPALPDRTNVEFVRVGGPDAFEVRVWERGSGETRACGSGACAVLAAAVQTGRALPDRPVQMSLPGGVLTVCQTANGTIELSGPAKIAFTGVVTE